jgi:hypothetical protein
LNSILDVGLSEIISTLYPSGTKFSIKDYGINGSRSKLLIKIGGQN